MRIRVQRHLGQECTPVFMERGVIEESADAVYARSDYYGTRPRTYPLPSRRRIEATLREPPQSVIDLFMYAHYALENLIVTLPPEHYGLDQLRMLVKRVSFDQGPGIKRMNVTLEEA